jgi:hypothetical protein
MTQQLPLNPVLGRTQRRQLSNRSGDRSGYRTGVDLTAQCRLIFEFLQYVVKEQKPTKDAPNDVIAKVRRASKMAILDGIQRLGIKLSGDFFKTESAAKLAGRAGTRRVSPQPRDRGTRNAV